MFSRQIILTRAMLRFAESVSYASKCNRARVGSVLTDLDFQVISYGYNGVAKNLPNRCLRPEAQGKCGCVHAEVNAVAKAGQPGVEKIAFITMPPCEMCASVLVNNDVKLVVLAGGGHREYSEGIVRVLQPLGISVIQDVDRLDDPDLEVALGKALTKLQTSSTMG